MSVLEDYFPQEIDKLITQAAYIKPDVRFEGSRRMAIDSTGRIWEGKAGHSMKKLQVAERVQAFGQDALTFITIEGKLTGLDSDGDLIKYHLGVDILSVGNLGGGFHYITPTGKLYIEEKEPITLPEPIVQLVFDRNIVYLLTVTGRTIGYDTTLKQITFIDETTDTVKLAIDMLSDCLQLKVDGTIWILEEDGVLDRKNYQASKELGRVIDLKTSGNSVILLYNKGSLVSVLYRRFVVEQTDKYPLAFDVNSNTIIVVTKDGRIIMRNLISPSSPYETISRVKLT